MVENEREFVLKVAHGLLSVCDGAIELDYEGYNKPDAFSVRDLLSREELSGNELEILRQTLLKYRRQITGMGFGYNRLLRMKFGGEVRTKMGRFKVLSYEELKRKRALESVEFGLFQSPYGGKVWVSFEFSNELVEKVKSLPWEQTHRSWNPTERRWELDATQESIKLFEEVVGIVVPQEVKNRLTGVSFPPEPEKLSRVRFQGNYAVVNYPSTEEYEEAYEVATRKLTYQLEGWDRNGPYSIQVKRFYEHPERLEIATFRGLLKRLYNRSLDYGVKADGTLDIPLRLYQKESLTAILEQIKQIGEATFQATAGSGKTEVAIAVWASLGKPKTFFLSLNTDLLVQAIQRWNKYGFDAGLVNADNFEIDKNVVCCTIQTLYRAIEKVESNKGKYNGNNGLSDEVKELLEETEVKDAQSLVDAYKSAKLVIFDEVQHCPARTVFGCLYSHPNTVRLGLSATPWRDDGRDMDIYAMCGDVVSRKVTSSELIRAGYLLPARVNFVEYDGNNRGDSWMETKRNVFSDEARCELIARIAKQAEKPVLVLVKEIKHGRLIDDACKVEGLDTYFISGLMNVKKRAKLIELGREKKLEVIIATTLADEGLDWPSLRTLIIAGGGKSSTRALQRVGRVVRPSEGKEYAVVYDIWDNCKYFKSHAKQRERIYVTEPEWAIQHVVGK